MDTGVRVQQRKPRLMQQTHTRQGEIMRDLRVEAEQYRADEGVREWHCVGGVVCPAIIKATLSMKADMTQDELKQAVAQAALRHVPHDQIIGVGTGSTVNFFIDALATMKHKVRGAVSSSERSTDRLKSHGIQVLDLNDVDAIPVYIDGADELDVSGAMIKGGGGALTREKIIAEVADRFVCIVDASKLVSVLGQFPLPVEVIPMARELVARRLRALGGDPRPREGYLTDNGNIILDVHGLSIAQPRALETAINQIPGVVTVGLFAHRGANVALIGTADGVQEKTYA